MRTYEENRLIAINMTANVWLRNLIADEEELDAVGKMFKKTMKAWLVSMASTDSLVSAETSLDTLLLFMDDANMETADNMRKTLNQVQEWLTLPDLNE